MNLIRRILNPQRFRLLAWLSLISQILIVVTGGVVRLTGSGLGCPTWPKCTEDSLVNVPEMGIHGIIEFGNRLLTFVLLIIAVATWLAIVLNRRIETVRAMRVTFPATVLLLGIPAQAVLGGFTVWSQLNPWFVGAHFVLSGVMISFATVLLFRIWKPKQSDSKLSKSLAWPVIIVGWATVLIGVLVTGAGPHSGDAESVRNGLDLEIWQHYHSYPAYLSLLLAVLVLVSNFRESGARSTSTRVSALLFVVLVIQAVIGIAQARLGVPALLVGFHMLGAATLISLFTLQWLMAQGKHVAQGEN